MRPGAVGAPTMTARPDDHAGSQFELRGGIGADTGDRQDAAQLVAVRNISSPTDSLRR